MSKYWKRQINSNTLVLFREDKRVEGEGQTKDHREEKKKSGKRDDLIEKCL